MSREFDSGAIITSTLHKTQTNFSEMAHHTKEIGTTQYIHIKLRSTAFMWNI
jgi:hypothetical protein